MPNWVLTSINFITRNEYLMIAGPPLHSQHITLNQQPPHRHYQTNSTTCDKLIGNKRDSYIASMYVNASSDCSARSDITTTNINDSNSPTIYAHNNINNTTEETHLIKTTTTREECESTSGKRQDDRVLLSEIYSRGSGGSDTMYTSLHCTGTSAPDTPSPVLYLKYFPYTIRQL